VRGKTRVRSGVVDHPLPSVSPEGETIAGSVRRGTASIAAARDFLAGAR